jgi:hypothetical protein
LYLQSVVNSLPSALANACPFYVLPSPIQDWECLYFLTKARRLRDASDKLAPMVTTTTIATASSQAPAYVASRVEEVRALPEVEVEGWLGGGRRRSTRGVDEGLLLKEAVVRHVVEGLRSELARDLLAEVVGV